MCRRPPTLARRLAQLVHAGTSGNALAKPLIINRKLRTGALVQRFSTPARVQIRRGVASAKFPSHKMLYRACPKFMHKRTTKEFSYKKQWTRLFMLACASPHQLHQYPQLAHHTEIHGAPRPPVAMQ